MELPSGRLCFVYHLLATTVYCGVLRVQSYVLTRWLLWPRVAVSVEADRPAIAVAYFPVCSALAQLKVYLKGTPLTVHMLQSAPWHKLHQCICVLHTDMGGLTFQLGLGHMTEDSLVIGQCHVPDVAALLPASTLRGCVISVCIWTWLCFYWQAIPCCECQWEPPWSAQLGHETGDEAATAQRSRPQL